MPHEYVFIVGCARSGTTLLRQILSLSERVCIAPETHFIRRFANARRWGNLSDTANVERLIDFMYAGRQTAGSAYYGWLQRNVSRDDFRARVRASERTARGIFQTLIEVYAERTHGRIDDAMVLGEKTPAHFYYLPTLRAWFPNARIIHMFRDPRAILVSELKKMRKKGREGPKRLLPMLPGWLLEPFEFPVELVHTTRAWLDAARIHADCAERYPHHYLLVRFEDLVTQPEVEIRRVCEFLKVDFQPAMMADVRVVGSSYQPQHRGNAGFDASARDRWKTHLPPALNWWFTLFGGAQLKKFGYG